MTPELELLYEVTVLRELRQLRQEMRELRSIILWERRTIEMNIADIQAKADATLQQVQKDSDVVSAVKTVVDHQNDTLAQLKSQIADLQAQNDPAALQKLSDTIDAIMSTDMTNSKVVSSAVTAGTPIDPIPAPAPTPTPVPDSPPDQAPPDQSGENSTT